MALLPFRSWRAAARARERARDGRARRLGDRARGLVGAGAGLETTLAQVAADTLKLPFERVRILHGSTTYLREGFGTFASRSMVVGGSAVMDGCNNLIAAIRAAATERFGLPNEEITVAGGEVRAGEKRASLADFAGLEAEELFDRDPHLQLRRPRLPLGGGRARARRDLDYVAIEDVGRAVNPHIVHGQAIGALVQGLGGVFLDQCSTTATRRSSTRRSPTISCRSPAISPMCAPSPWSCGAQDQSARRQGCGRGRHGGGGGDGRQCGGGGARSSRRRGARAAAVARASVAAGQRRARGAGEFSG